MAEFPAVIPTFRALENLPHVTYNENQKKTIFAEDMAKIHDELRAAMTYLKDARADIDALETKVAAAMAGIGEF